MKNISISRRAVTVAAVIVYIALAAMLAKHFLAPTKSKSFATASPGVTETLQTVQAGLKKAYPSMDVTSSLLGAWQAEAVASAQPSDSLLMPGNDKPNVSQTPSLAWSWLDGIPTRQAMHRNVAAMLIRDGFAQDNSREQKVLNNNQPSFYMTYNFHRHGVHCMIIETEADRYADELHCYDSETLQATTGGPFAQAYESARATNPKLPKVAKYVQVRIASQNQGGTIFSSQTAGYDIAEVSIIPEGQKDARLLLFYNYHDQWHYVTTAGDEYGFSCGDMMSDPRARAAFYNQVCYNFGPSGSLGTQRLDTNNHY